MLGNIYSHFKNDKVNLGLLILLLFGLVVTGFIDLLGVPFSLLLSIIAFAVLVSRLTRDQSLINSLFLWLFTSVLFYSAILVVGHIHTSYYNYESGVVIFLFVIAGALGSFVSLILLLVSRLKKPTLLIIFWIVASVAAIYALYEEYHGSLYVFKNLIPSALSLISEAKQKLL